MDPTRQCLKLLPSIYGSVESPRLWAPLLESVSRVLRGESMLDIYEPQKGQGKVIRAIEDSHSKFRGLNEAYARVDFFVERARTFLRFEVPFRDNELYAESEDWHENEYKVCLRNFAQYCTLGCLVCIEPPLLSFFSCNRSKRKGPFSIADKKLVQLLLPHFRKALQLTQKLEKLEGKAIASDSLSVGVITLNAEGALLSVNRSAQVILDQKDGLSITSGGLVAAFPAVQERLFQLLSVATHSSLGKGFGLGDKLVVPRPSGRKPLMLQVCPCRAHRSMNSVQAPTAILFVSDSEFIPHDRSAELSRLYALTPAECRISSLIAEGKDAKEIRTQLGITQATIKTHLKHIFLKVGVRRQSELVSVLLRPSWPHGIS